MSFIDSYKRLEKLCSEMYGNNHGVSTYIDEMAGKPSGSYYVSGWDEDLRRLKHYRWVRNQIVHDPGCAEENMCEPGDAQWLDNFYSRILSTNDPLALYRKAQSPRTSQKPKQTYSSEPAWYTPPRTNDTPPQHKKPVGCFTYLMWALLIVLIMALISNIILYYFGVML